MRPVPLLRLHRPLKRKIIRLYTLSILETTWVSYPRKPLPFNATLPHEWIRRKCPLDSEPTASLRHRFVILHAGTSELSRAQKIVL